MPRELCPNCHYPLISCLCDSIKHISHETRVSILQHPSEVKNKKNTVRLLELASSEIKTYVGETENDFQSVKQQLEDDTYLHLLLFASETAQNWQHYSNKVDSDKKIHLIVLDGTWRKAKKILLLNSWLSALPHLILDSFYQSQYGIRKTNIEGGLSTLEAVAYTLQQIEQLDSKPFFELLDAFKHAFTKQMPENVKQRYKE